MQRRLAGGVTATRARKKTTSTAHQMFAAFRSLHGVHYRHEHNSQQTSSTTSSDLLGWRVLLKNLQKAEDIECLKKACDEAQSYLDRHAGKLNTKAKIYFRTLLQYQQKLLNKLIGCSHRKHIPEIENYLKLFKNNLQKAPLGVSEEFADNIKKWDSFIEKRKAKQARDSKQNPGSLVRFAPETKEPTGPQSEVKISASAPDPGSDASLNKTPDTEIQQTEANSGTVSNKQPTNQVTSLATQQPSYGTFENDCDDECSSPAEDLGSEHSGSEGDDEDDSLLQTTLEKAPENPEDHEQEIKSHQTQLQAQKPNLPILSSNPSLSIPLLKDNTPSSSHQTKPVATSGPEKETGCWCCWFSSRQGDKNISANHALAGPGDQKMPNDLSKKAP